jgi:hypothetical protein
MTDNPIVDLKVGAIQVQHKAVGVFKHLGEVFPVIEYDEETDMVQYILVGRFLGVQDTHISAKNGEYLPFPDGKTLAQMIAEPFDWYHWCKDNGVK